MQYLMGSIGSLMMFFSQLGVSNVFELNFVLYQCSSFLYYFSLYPVYVVVLTSMTSWSHQYFSIFTRYPDEAIFQIGPALGFCFGW